MALARFPIRSSLEIGPTLRDELRNLLQYGDLTFRDFMADPFVTIGKVYDALGMELTDEALGTMKRFLEEHPADAHGGHRYAWENTGLDVGEWREQSQRYQERFDVPSEVD